VTRPAPTREPVRAPTGPPMAAPATKPTPTPPPYSMLSRLMCEPGLLRLHCRRGFRSQAFADLCVEPVAGAVGRMTVSGLRAHGAVTAQRSGETFMTLAVDLKRRWE